jgi:hypothetical protein
MSHFFDFLSSSFTVTGLQLGNSDVSFWDGQTCGVDGHRIADVLFSISFFFVSHYLLVKFRSFCSKDETPVSGGAWLHVCGCFRKNNIHVVVGSKRVEGCAPM